jgi:putative Holliday junction resolvase
MNHEAGRVLGVDYGEARIGLALSDPSRTIVSPLKVLAFKGTAKRAAHLVKEEVEAQGAALVVVGLPYSLSGERGPMAKVVEQFAAALRALVTVPVEFHDERLSSLEAERLMASSGLSTRDMRGRLDKVAAAIMLQGYLDCHKGAVE